MQHTLVAVFDNRSDAQSAMDELLGAGFTRTNVNVSSADAGTEGDTGTGAVGTSGDTHHEGVGASISHFFSNLFGADNDEHATRYAGAVSQGRHVLTVTAESEPEVERAADVVERFGPVDIDERHDLSGSAAGMDPGMLAAGAASGSSLGSSMQSGSTGSAGSASYGASASTGSLSGSMQRDMGEQLNDQRSTTIPVVQEELKVGKREVQRGGLRVFSRVIETPVNETVNLREEHVNVERRPVDQPISPADTTAFKEQSVELRERAEEAVVEKTARVVEEVVVSKEATQRQENISDTVRHTEVQVEQLGGSSLNDDTYYRNHYTSTYGAAGGSYDDYAPAYAYGTQMRGDTRYQGRQWDDVESNLRTDWESRSGAASGSSWEKMKAAVRHGWDKVAH